MKLLRSVTLFLATTVVHASMETVPPPRQHSPPKEGINWEEFNFSLNGVKTDAMWVNTIAVGKESFAADRTRSLRPMGMLTLSPAATVLNYGQALFEGMKALRRHDGSIALFRPERNAWRMQQGAERFLLPVVPTDVFVAAAEEMVRANAQWIPPSGKGAFYLRTCMYAYRERTANVLES